MNQPALSYDELRQLAQFLGVVLLGVGVLLRVLPVDRCDSCAHCRQQSLLNAICVQHHKKRKDCADQHRD